MSNCIANIEVSGIQLIRVEHLPSNANSFLQLIDQRIINSFKRKLKKGTFSKRNPWLGWKDPYEIDILGAMNSSISAWNDVSIQFPMPFAALGFL